MNSTGTRDPRTRRHHYGFDPNGTDWTSTSSPVVRRVSVPLPVFQDASRVAYDPWRPTHQPPVLEDFAPMASPVQPQALMRMLLLYSQQARESAPRLWEQGDFQASASTQEDSRLSQDEQMQALKMLRKETYNPVPKRLSSRLCLYYRDQAADIVKQRERENEEDAKRCAVCLEDFKPKEMVMLTPCNHMFHEECIVPWVKSQAKCPVCRYAF